MTCAASGMDFWKSLGHLLGPGKNAREFLLPHESSALRNQSPGPWEGCEEEGLRERWAGGSSDSSPFVPSFYQEYKTVDRMYRLHLSRFPSSLVHWPGTFFIAGEGVFCSFHLIRDPHVVVRLLNIFPSFCLILPFLFVWV